MSDDSLHAELLRLAHEEPKTRKVIVPMLREAARMKVRRKDTKRVVWVSPDTFRSSDEYERIPEGEDRPKLTRTEQDIMDVLDKRGRESFEMGYVRPRETSRNTSKNVPMNLQRGKAALALEKKGLVKIERQPSGGRGERVTTLIITPVSSRR